MPEARVGGEPEFLLLTPIPTTGAPEQAVAVLTLNGLTAATTIEQQWGTGFEDLVSFFASLEANWRGWRGSKTWQSLEGDLRLDARHSGGLVELKVAIQRPRFDRGNDGWSAEGDLTIEPGEELTRTAREIRAFAKGD